MSLRYLQKPSSAEDQHNISVNILIHSVDPVAKFNFLRIRV